MGKAHIDKRWSRKGDKFFRKKKSVPPPPSSSSDEESSSSSEEEASDCRGRSCKSSKKKENHRSSKKGKKMSSYFQNWLKKQKSKHEGNKEDEEEEEDDEVTISASENVSSEEDSDYTEEGEEEEEETEDERASDDEEEEISATSGSQAESETETRKRHLKKRLKEKAKSKSKKSKKERSKKSKKSKDKVKQKKKRSSSSESSSDSSSSSEEEDGSSVDGKNLNIILTIGGGDGDDDTEYDYDFEGTDDLEADEKTEDEDEEVSTDESSTEAESDVSSASSSSASESEKKAAKKRKRDKKKEPDQASSGDDSSKGVQPNEETLQNLRKLQEAAPHDKGIRKCIAAYEADLQKYSEKAKKKEKKQKEKNLRIFRKMLKDKVMNDFTFYEKLEIEQQKKVIKELREVNKVTRIEKPYRMTLLEAQIPIEFKAAAMKRVNSLRSMEPGSGEFYKCKNWVDTFMRIPFGKYEGLPISVDDGVEKCHDFMENAQKILDKAVYGMSDAKMQIMQMLGQLLTNPKAIGTAIAIHGPPGTGKTSIVKEGISKILNRPFAFIALGGATDSSFLEGHGFTYEGSTWGKIVQILVESRCMNPVIYFDELDKISETPRGEEIAGILTHLTDTSQNSQFHDKFFAEIDFDLSKCLFIFSYNDESKVNPILKDRMYRIKTKGYSPKEKATIANDYLLPKIQEQVRFKSGEIVIPNETINYLLESHCSNEDGVRNLKRCLEIIYTKANLFRLMRPGTNLFEGEMSLKVEFPLHVTKQIADKLVKKESERLETWRSLYT